MNILGQTTSGKNVFVNQTADFEGYKDFTAQDHADASMLYNDRRVKFRLTKLAHDRSLDIEYSHTKRQRELLELSKNNPIFTS